jgi:hypothetical protein
MVLGILPITGLHCDIQEAKATIAAPAKIPEIMLKDNFFFF